jgi:hypothetical protein
MENALLLTGVVLQNKGKHVLFFYPVERILQLSLSLSLSATRLMESLLPFLFLTNGK